MPYVRPNNSNFKIYTIPNITSLLFTFLILVSREIWQLNGCDSCVCSTDWLVLSSYFYFLSICGYGGGGISSTYSSTLFFEYSDFLKLSTTFSTTGWIYSWSTASQWLFRSANNCVWDTKHYLNIFSKWLVWVVAFMFSYCCWNCCWLVCD